MPKRSIAVLVLLETDDPRLDPDHIDGDLLLLLKGSGI